MARHDAPPRSTAAASAADLSAAAAGATAPRGSAGAPELREAAVRIARALLDEPWHQAGGGQGRAGMLSPSDPRGEPTPQRGHCQTECLIEDGDERTAVDLELRFLQARARAADGAREAVERSVVHRAISLAALVGRPQTRWFTFESSAPPGYSEQRLDGAIELRAVRIASSLYRLTVRICNLTPATGTTGEAALARSMLATHTVLEVHRGQFVSRLDPPPRLREVVDRCANVGAWPVLIGTPGGARTVVLSAPLMLYDYPRAAAHRAQPAPAGAPGRANVDDIVDQLASVGGSIPLPRL
jgi:hypothetical protein